MDICAKRGFEVIEKLAFVRVSGTPEEKRAADLLYEMAAQTGAQCEIDPFKVEDGIVHSATLEVLEPYYKKYEVTGYLRSQSTPAEGLVADFEYVEGALEANLINAKGKVVLFNGPLKRPMYEAMKKAGIAGMICPSGKLLDHLDESDLAINKLRPTYTEECGSTVAVTTRITDAMEMVNRKASKVKITVDSECIKRTSHNVYATVQGTEYPDEIIALGAHYDSVHFSTGVYDNAAGSAVLMELLRHFAKNPPRRTLRFMWFGSEEQGLLGSKHYTANNPELMEKTCLMINADVGAPVLGQNLVFVIGEQGATDYVDGMLKAVGIATKVKQSIYSSDCIPFADAGIPAINFLRVGAQGAFYIHNRDDRMFFLSAEGLEPTIKSAALFTDHVANAVVMPIARSIPANMVDEVNKYLGKKSNK